MKARLMEYIKSSTIIDKIYYYVGSLLINLIKIFVRTESNLILFVSFGGKKYNDSPKAIYESMIEDERFENYNFVWAFKTPANFDLPANAEVIKIDSLKYFLISLKARIWITNSTIERRLNYRGKNTFYFNTWHGTPIKKIGDETSIMYGKSKYDIVCAQGDFDVKVFKQAFNIKRESIITCGLPRNDVLAQANEEIQFKIKRKLNIPIDKKVILYCPTYRDWKKNYESEKVNFEKWQEVLGDNYIVLFRSHAKVIEQQLYKIPDFVMDVTDYQELNDLMIASDMLITDYSSLSIDYSILEKPIICYTYDYKEYVSKRGVYFDIRKELPGGSISEDDLLDRIKNMPNEETIRAVKNFKEKYVQYYGNATEQTLDLINAII